MSTPFHLPNLGENIEGGDLVTLLVAEGDSVEVDQALCEIETDKAMVEVPSPSAGVIGKIHISEGDTIKVGQLLMDITGGAAVPKKAEPKKDPAPKPASKKEIPVIAEPTAPTPPPSPPVPPIAKPTPKPAPPVKTQTASTAPAGPATRRLARELGVDLSSIGGSGAGGRITREDVIAAARNPAPAPGSPAANAASEAPGEAGQDDHGPITRDKLPKIRQTIARNLVQSAVTIPHVTNFDDADVTDLEAMRQEVKSDFAEQGLKITTMPLLIKACALALRKNPSVNASIDMDAQQIIYKQYVNIGIAIDTDRGLVVPSLRHVDQLSIAGIAQSLTQTVDKVRAGKVTIDDMRGSTFTISNLGAIGGTYSTPIINPPEVAILLVGRSRQMPIVQSDGSIAPRLMMPLSLSYDHRLVDGAAAARFLNDVKAYLQSPAKLLMG